MNFLTELALNRHLELSDTLLKGIALLITSCFAMSIAMILWLIWEIRASKKDL